jgi:hypothetical protein
MRGQRARRRMIPVSAQRDGDRCARRVRITAVGDVHHRVVGERPAGHGGGGGIAEIVAVTVLVLVEVLVVVDVLVLVVGSIEEDVVDDEELLGVVVVVLCVGSVVVDVDGDVVVVVVVREVDDFGVIGPLVLEFDPPKIKKITVVNRTPPIAPYITSAQGFVYQGSGGGPSGPGGPPGGGGPVGMSSVGCSE